MIRKTCFVWICGVLLAGACAWGVPVNENTYADAQARQESNPTGYGYSLDWSYVYNYKGCSGVAIAPYWLLTAEHVADDPVSGNLLINGQTYTVMDTIPHSSADIALVRYDKAFPGYYSYSTSTSFDGSEVIMIGYGDYGLVTQTPTSGWWSDPGPESPDVKRWGTNTIDGLGGTPALLVTTISGTNPGQDPTPYETGLNTGDSGGGTFAYDDVAGKWVLIGIHSARGGDPYDTTGSVPVGNYTTWIEDYIPEPVTIWSLAIPTLLTVLARRRR